MDGGIVGGVGAYSAYSGAPDQGAVVTLVDLAGALDLRELWGHALGE